DDLRAGPLRRFGVRAEPLLDGGCGWRRHADLGSKKKPHTVSGAGARFLPETLLRSGRRPAPAANERKQSDDAKKERGAKLQRGGRQDVGARELGVHRTTWVTLDAVRCQTESTSHPTFAGCGIQRICRSLGRK